MSKLQKSKSAEAAAQQATRDDPATRLACCGSLVTEPLDDATADQVAGAFAALADPVRLRLLNLVAQAGEVCSCDLQEPLGKSQPTISHHTKILAEAGLITGEKRGRWVWWSVATDRLDDLRATLGS